MDYFQGVVTEYLRANRATFVNTECLIQLEAGDTPAKGQHWYCDAVAVNFKEKTVGLRRGRGLAGRRLRIYRAGQGPVSRSINCTENRPSGQDGHRIDAPSAVTNICRRALG